MIAAVSLMRRKAGLDQVRFARHWLDPHGVMTAELPGLRRYIQCHPVDGPATNDLARNLDVAGIPILWFDDYAARRLAYTSPRIAECNLDSEHFVGAVTRLVTEPEEVRIAPSGPDTAKVILLATGAPDAAWAARARARLLALPCLLGYRAHRILEQAKAPASRIPELDLPIAGLAEAVFADRAGLAAALPHLVGDRDDAARTAVYDIVDHVLR